MKRVNPDIEAQAKRVRALYDPLKGNTPEFLREFDKLSQMRAQEAAANFRAERGLPPSAPTPYDDPASRRPLWPGENSYGLDVPYFTEVVRRDLSDLSHRTPEEMARICLRMADTACSPVMAEPEFVANFASALRLDASHLRRDAQVGSLLRLIAEKAAPEWKVSLALEADGYSLGVIAPDQQYQVEASGLKPESAQLCDALMCLLNDLESGACMREYVERVYDQTPEQVRDALREVVRKEGSEAEVRDLVMGFADYQAFEDWFETLEHYEMEDGDHLQSAADRAAMRIAFHLLRSEIDPLGLAVRQATGYPFGQPVHITTESIPAGRR